MRRRILIPLVVAVLTAAVCPSFKPAAPAQSIGDRPPALSAGKWFHWIGDGPTLESLEGRTVLVHFFVCKEPKKAAWLGLMKFHDEHAAKGLVILAVTRDSRSAVENFLEDYPLPFPVGAASEMQATWDANGDYGQVLLDKHGEIFYRTDASNGTWNGKLLKALKGSARLGDAAYLRMVPLAEYGRGMKRAIDQLGDGKLSKALAGLDSIVAGASSKDEDRADAESLRGAVETHITTLMEQIEESVERREVISAHDALAALAKELKRHPLGEPARTRLAELEDDEAFAEELEAAEQYERLVAAFFTRGWKKNLARFEKLIEDFPETRAAEKLKNYWIAKAW